MGEPAASSGRTDYHGGPFWPWSVRSAVLALPVSVVVLLVVIGITRAAAGWPSDANERAVLIGVLLLAVLPMVLVLLGSLAGGGSVEALGVKVRFPERAKATPEVRVPSSMGLQPGMPLNDSTTMHILDTLKASTLSDISVLDLEDGAAWWETRLLVLCAGATRLGRPSAVVFVGTVGGVPQTFLGWAPPTELQRCLLSRRDDLRRAFDRADAVHRQWQLAVPPLLAEQAGAPAPTPTPPFPITPEALGAQWVVFPPGDNNRNPLAAEQLLALQLGPIEERGAHGTVNTIRLADLFAPVLRTAYVDLDRARDNTDWVRTLLGSTERFVPLTNGTAYAGMLPRDQAVNDVLRSLLAAAIEPP
jgi:hypothetical protein